MRLRRNQAAAPLAPDDRERHALEIHDNLVQGLTAIHWALEAGAYEQAREATGWDLAVASDLKTSEEPTAEELEALRELQASGQPA